MLKRNFDHQLPHVYLRYGRMSSDDQNPRSPEQQFDTVEMIRQRLHYPWRHVTDYRDDGISGRYMQKRLGFQTMLNDIRSGAVRVDLILVDTFERFGRADATAAIRQELCNRYGVLLLTADSNFADPTTTSGKALAVLESFRSTEDSRIKAHLVSRGKRDAARQKHWPGGPPPFGLRLESILIDRNGRQEVDHCILVPEPETAWILQHAYQRALETGWGQDRLAKDLNDNPQIPDKFKPFHPSTVGRWMNKDSTIYYGELTYERDATDVIDEHRVIERNSDDEMVRVPNFCEALVSRETWDAVRRLKEIRGARIRAGRERRRGQGDKQIDPLIAGIALKYLLSGLVRCGHCGRSMNPSSSGEYTTKDGQTKRYVSYVCPLSHSGVCDNRIKVPEQWLREAVIGKLRERLFPSSE
jgi:site-specific DNA recombinase